MVYNSRDGHKKCLDICVCPMYLITKSCPSVKHVILTVIDDVFYVPSVMYMCVDSGNTHTHKHTMGTL